MVGRPPLWRIHAVEAAAVQTLCLLPLHCDDASGLEAIPCTLQSPPVKPGELSESAETEFFGPDSAIRAPEELPIQNCAYDAALSFGETTSDPGEQDPLRNLTVRLAAIP